MVPIKRTFGRRTEPKLSVNIDINGTTVTAMTDRENSTELERSLKRRLREFL
jgi:hypothetical protein